MEYIYNNCHKSIPFVIKVGRIMLNNKNVNDILKLGLIGLTNICVTLIKFY